MAKENMNQMTISFIHLSKLTVSPEKEPFDGDPTKFMLGIEAMRLSLAYE